MNRITEALLQIAFSLYAYPVAAWNYLMQRLAD